MLCLTQETGCQLERARCYKWAVLILEEAGDQVGTEVLKGERHKCLRDLESIRVVEELL